MSGNLLATNTVSLSDLLSGEKRFEVPLYQRDYSWTQEHWEDLWNDILDISQDFDTKHYMGSLVLQQDQERKYKIIDGQQRITTLSIFVVAVLSILNDLIDQDNEANDNKRRAKIIRERFIGDEDPTSLRYSSKLSLNNNNKDIYERFLIQLDTPRNLRGINASSKLILKCKDYFKEKIVTYAQSELTGEYVVDFLTNQVARKLIFIQIEVEDELSAYTVFETLNARGVELSSSDLLKNYLFSLLVSSTDQDIIQRQWDKICFNVKSEDLPDFLRYYINSTERFVRSHQLFKRIKVNIQTAANAQKFLNDLEQESEVFNALKDPSSDYWSGYPEISKYLKSIKVFGAKQIYPLLMACVRKFANSEVIRVLKLIEAILFRYSVIGKLNPNSLESILSKAAVGVHSGQLTTPRAIFNELKDVYVNDGDFLQSFKKARIVTKNRKKVVRYILFKIENSLRQTELDWETNSGTIEHILPENPSDKWTEVIATRDHEEYIYRLGNYCLLSPSDNKRVGNDSLSTKQSIYQMSDYQLSNEIIDEIWNKESIECRQQMLAERAVVLWKSDYLI
ncbi:DUF262 domain-containing protein [Brumicola nitratireducens]|uniref:DUF262 domain-containing protein n=1 Tax=Glaciecola nitratireducens (strain JCM 12485 / KCTC 12276 / FR1064) TaxID=1085623 RepID=G4QH80_GLANF|nr:DUF262 domain-containing protein [Glaciecola nitratireducens]AEP29711.1 hypothetical protein GNIT_1594 [Glaciecola nitratireducens FR1064]